MCIVPIIGMYIQAYVGILMPKCQYIDSALICVVVLNKLSLEKYEVLWMADDTIFKQKKEITSQLWSMVGEKLGKGQAYGAARLVINFTIHTFELSQLKENLENRER